MSGIRLRSYSGNVYRFDPGALCLEFLVTGGPGALTRHEVLHTPDDLVRWADQSRLTPTPPALHFTDDDVAYARRLRDALARTVVSRVCGGGLPELGIAPADTADVDLLNEAAAHPPLAPAIGADGTRGWAAGRRPARSSSPPSPATPSSSSPGRTRNGSACAPATAATSSTSTPPGPAAAAGARWSTAATATRSAPTACAAPGSTRSSRSPREG